MSRQHYDATALADNRASDLLRQNFLAACGRSGESPRLVFALLGITGTTIAAKFLSGGNLPWYYHHLLGQYITYHPAPSHKAKPCSLPSASSSYATSHSASPPPA